MASSGWVYPLVTSPLNIQALLILLVFLGLSYSVLRFMLDFFQNGDALVNAVKNRGGKRKRNESATAPSGPRPEGAAACRKRPSMVKVKSRARLAADQPNAAARGGFQDGPGVERTAGR